MDEHQPRYHHLSILHLLLITAAFAAAWSIAGFGFSFVLIGWYTAVQFCRTPRARVLAVAVPFFLAIAGSLIVLVWGLLNFSFVH